MTPDGLQPLLDVSIYGRISQMSLFRPQRGAKQDRLFLLTERYRFCILEYNPQTREIVTLANGDVQQYAEDGTPLAP